MQLGKEGKLTSLFLPPYSGNVPNVGPIPKRKSELFAFHPRVFLLQSCSFGYPLLNFFPDAFFLVGDAGPPMTYVVVCDPSTGHKFNGYRESTSNWYKMDQIGKKSDGTIR